MESIRGRFLAEKSTHVYNTRGASDLGESACQLMVCAREPHRIPT